MWHAAIAATGTWLVLTKAYRTAFINADNGECRKRRCDGQTPQCRTCRQRGLECIYQEPVLQKYAYVVVRRLDNVLNLVRHDERDPSEADLQRFDRIEELLSEHSAAIKDLHQSSTLSASTSSPTTTSTPRSDFCDTVSNNLAQRPQYQSTLSTSSTWAPNNSDSVPSHHQADDVPPLTIPLGHQTSTSSLLMLPQMRSLVGDFPEEFVFLIEDSRPLPMPLQSIGHPLEELAPDCFLIDRTFADDCLEHFLTLVHPFRPFLDRDDLMARYEESMSQGLQYDNNSALFLSIFALGATATDPIDRNRNIYSGDKFVQAALRILFSSWAVSFNGNLVLCQALVLCALYFTYLVEPLPAWKLIHMASTNIQQILIRLGFRDISLSFVSSNKSHRRKGVLSRDAETQDITRTSWVCFVIEWYAHKLTSQRWQNSNG
jgi:Fungal Zn(2)-Cys(6) binuclear cluster domain